MEGRRRKVSLEFQIVSVARNLSSLRFIFLHEHYLQIRKGTNQRARLKLSQWKRHRVGQIPKNEKNYLAFVLYVVNSILALIVFDGFS